MTVKAMVKNIILPIQMYHYSSQSRRDYLSIYTSSYRLLLHSDPLAVVKQPAAPAPQKQPNPIWKQDLNDLLNYIEQPPVTSISQTVVQQTQTLPPVQESKKRKKNKGKQNKEEPLEESKVSEPLIEEEDQDDEALEDEIIL